MKHNIKFYEKNRRIVLSENSNKKRAKNISIVVKGRKKEEYKYLEKLSIRMKKNNPMSKDQIKNKMIKSCKEFYKNNPDKELERKINFINAPLYNKNRINKYEKRILYICENRKELKNICFTGDGKFWVSFGKKHKNPDFKIKNQRKVIEVGNSYWHNDEDVKNTIKNYNKINFECLYLREKELFVDDELLYNKLYKFVKNHDAKIIKIKKLQKNHRSFKNEKYKYNLEIEDNHNYFVNSILVSNCHNIESVVTDFASLTFTRYYVQDTLKIPFPNVNRMKIEDFVKWIKNVYAVKLSNGYLALESKVGSMSSESYLESNSGMASMKKIEDYKRKMDNISTGLKNFNKDEWVMTVSPTQDIVSIKPIFANKYTNNMLFRFADKVLLMSGTVLNKNTFCQNIGIDPSKAEFLSLDSPFPVKNRPVFEVPVGSMGRKSIDSTLPILVETIKELLEHHKNEKGIIHCVDENTKIKMYDNTEKFIKDIKTGDEIITYNEIAGKFENKNVKNSFDNGKRQCLKLKVRDKELICTFDHLILTKNRGWVKAIDLDKNDNVV